MTSRPREFDRNDAKHVYFAAAKRGGCRAASALLAEFEHGNREAFLAKPQSAKPTSVREGCVLHPEGVYGQAGKYSACERLWAARASRFGAHDEVQGDDRSLPTGRRFPQPNGAEHVRLHKGGHRQRNVLVRVGQLEGRAARAAVEAQIRE